MSAVCVNIFIFLNISTVINEIFLLDLGICEDFSENDKIIPTKSEINTQNGEYIFILYKSETFSKQNINSHETLFNLKIAVNPVDGHIGPILTSVLRLTMFLSRK